MAGLGASDGTEATAVVAVGQREKGARKCGRRYHHSVHSFTGLPISQLPAHPTARYVSSPAVQRPPTLLPAPTWDPAILAMAAM